MRLLLDTHVFLNIVDGSGDIHDAVRTATNEADQIFLSTASAWEIGIKYSKGKINLTGTPASYVQEMMRELRLAPLDITQLHAFRAASLPDIHRDPFDRMLVAQALCERLTLVTADRMIIKYDASVLNAITGKRRD